MAIEEAIQAVLATTTIIVDPPGGTHPHKAPYPQPTLVPGPTHTAYHFQHGTHLSAVFYWIFFGVFTAGLVGTAFLTTRVERRLRVFHILSGVALAIMSTTYLMLATGIGMTHSFGPPGDHHGHHGHHDHHGHHGHHGKHDHGHDHHKHKDPKDKEPIETVATFAKAVAPVVVHFVRQRLWVRELAHIFTLPVFILQLVILSGMPLIAGLWAAFCGSMSCVGALMAVHFAAQRKFHMRPQFVAWGIVTVIWGGVMFAYLFISGVRASKLRTRKTQGRYIMLTALLFIGYLLCGVFHIVGSGLGILSVNAETIALGIADISAQVGFVFFILLTHVHDAEDDTYNFPAWLAEPRGDGRGDYAPVPTGVEAS